MDKAAKYIKYEGHTYRLREKTAKKPARPEMIKHEGKFYVLDKKATVKLQKQIKAKAAKAKSAAKPAAKEKQADDRAVETAPAGPFERKHLRAFARAISKSKLGIRSKKYVARIVAKVIGRYQKDFESDKFIGAATRSSTSIKG